ncbi:MAG: class I adenylate-forming enzyme family protein [Filomicrobium sp.]
MSQGLQERFLQSWTDVALIDAVREREFTYGELWLQSVAEADSMAQRGGSRGDTVAVAMSNGPDFVRCALACFIGGYVFVPVNLELSSGDVESILELARPSLIVREVTVANDANSLDPPPKPDKIPEIAFPGDEVCAIFFTSGTTGRPKGVRHTLDSMIGNVGSFNSFVGLDRDTRMYHTLPIAYMAGFLNTILSPLMAGGTVVFGPRFAARNALDFWSLPKRHAANTLWLTPTIAATLQRLVRDPEAAKTDASGFFQVFCGTAPLHDALRQSFYKSFALALQESYGTSELLLISTQRHDEGISKTDVGGTLAGIDLNIDRDADGNDELVVRSPFACKGYLTETGLLDLPVTPDGWVRTGDAARIDDGRLTITGRLKDLIIRGGVNVSPVAIENAFADMGGIRDVAVVGLPHAFWGETIAVCLEPEDGADHCSIIEGAKRIARERLGQAQKPDQFEVYDSLPRSVNGKILKNKIRADLSK